MALGFGNESYEKNIKVSTQNFLNVENKNGKVKIKTTSRDDIILKVTKRANKRNADFKDVQIKINETDSEINIKTKYETLLNPHISVDMELEIPHSLQLKEISSSNGKIILTDCVGNAEISSSNGSITAKNCVGDFKFTTSNASIYAQNINGKMAAFTSNGKITALGVSSLQRLSSSNGSIAAEVIELPEDLTISTSNASIDVYLSQDLNALIKANTSNVSVKLRGIAVNATDIGKSNLVGTLGGGGNTLKLSTSNGGIDINSLNYSSQ